MKSDYKRACILIDENDLRDFKDSYGYTFSKESLWIPLDFLPMMQVMLQEFEGSYYIPRVINEMECSIIVKSIYEESQKFLKQLLLANKIVDKIEDSFPLDYFWLCLSVGTYRIISFCDDFLNEHSVEEVVLIKRKKLVNHGGLLINMTSFSNLVEAFFKSKDVKVKIVEHEDCETRPKTIFYGQPHNLKSLLKYSIKFIVWKTLSINKRNYDYILINPGYDNVIHCYKSFKSSANKMSPQIFHGGQMPFLHSWGKWLRFLIASVLFKYKYSDDNEHIIKSYRCNFYNFEFDFAETFRGTIVQYLSDIRWMKNYINMFWNNCLERRKRYLTIFSLPPVHLHSYFLIKKAKEDDGKVAVWQHGGSYSYTEHFQHYITDYKNADYFLSFGKCNIKDVTKCAGDAFVTCVQVGSNVIYGKSVLRSSRVRKSWNSHGLFVPGVIGTLFSQASIKWRGDLQFEAVKQIVDYFDSGAGGKIVVKGLKNHKPHHELQRYIDIKKCKYISYTDIPLNKALSNNPKFVVLDDSSTPLLQVLAQYAGPIFLMVNQESCSILEDALALLKRRVVYSESVDELERQLTDFFKTGALGDIDIEDTSFVDVYLKRFSYPEYEHFLRDALKLLEILASRSQRRFGTLGF